ncbi:bestrophin-4-like [Glandiceps talaboti]
MTVSYSLKVSQAGLTSFPRLLFLWRGSIYKLIYKELVLFLAFYYALSVTYRFILDEEHKATFELLCVFFKDRFLIVIPISFLLGFYVSLVVSRWWDMYVIIPWTDDMAILLATHIHGYDEDSRIIRRTIVRWLNLAATIVFCSVSKPVLKRFPTMLHLVEVGLMTEDERKIYETLPTPHTKFWIPLCWMCTTLHRLRQEGKLYNDQALNLLLEITGKHYSRCNSMMNFDWVSVPLVYTQVVTIATYSFFIAKLFAAQFLDPSRGYESYWLDLYFPMLTVIEFFFYFGWLKVAQTIINPYGGDDDDFELNYIIDRNYQVALLIVDSMYGNIPPFQKDKHWDVKEFYLPYTLTTVDSKWTTSWLGSTVEVLLQARDFIVEVPKTFLFKSMTKPKRTDAQVGTDDNIDEPWSNMKRGPSELKLVLPATEDADKYCSTMQNELKSPVRTPSKRRRKRRRRRYVRHASAGVAGDDLEDVLSDTHSSRKSSVTWPPPISPGGVFLAEHRQRQSPRVDTTFKDDGISGRQRVPGISIRDHDVTPDDMTPLWIDVDDGRGVDNNDIGNNSSESSDDEWVECSTVMMPSGAMIDLEEIFKS